MGRYDFLNDFDEEVVCWYLTIEVEYGKPPYLLGSYYIAGEILDQFSIDELSGEVVPNSRLRELTCGVLLQNGKFNTWERIDARRKGKAYV